MSQRLQIVLADPIAERLRALARAAGEPPATLAAKLLRIQISGSSTSGRAATSPQESPAAPQSERPVWLEPYGGDPEWRRETWGAIVALHARYPRQLEHLNDDWYQHEAQVEQLSALAAWRAEIDEYGRDPREELSLHAQLEHYRDTLRSQAGGVTRAWIPGPPPSDWVE